MQLADCYFSDARFEAMRIEHQREVAILQARAEDQQRHLQQVFETGNEAIDLNRGQLIEQYNEDKRKLIGELQVEKQQLIGQCEAEKQQLIGHCEEDKQQLIGQFEVERQTLIDKYEAEKEQLARQNEEDRELLIIQFEEEKQCFIDKCEEDRKEEANRLEADLDGALEIQRIDLQVCNSVWVTFLRQYKWITLTTGTEYSLSL